MRKISTMRSSGNKIFKGQLRSDWIWEIVLVITVFSMMLAKWFWKMICRRPSLTMPALSNLF